MVGTNTILNVCPQGERFVVERFGKLLDIKESGWFLGTSSPPFSTSTRPPIDSSFLH